MKEWICYLLVAAALIGIVVLGIVCSKWIFEFVVDTDWPDWVKYIILRG